MRRPRTIDLRRPVGSDEAAAPLSPLDSEEVRLAVWMAIESAVALTFTGARCCRLKNIWCTGATLWRGRATDACPLVRGRATSCPYVIAAPTLTEAPAGPPASDRVAPFLLRSP